MSRGVWIVYGWIIEVKVNKIYFKFYVYVCFDVFSFIGRELNGFLSFWYRISCWKYNVICFESLVLFLILLDGFSWVVFEIVKLKFEINEIVIMWFLWNWNFWIVVFIFLIIDLCF